MSHKPTDLGGNRTGIARSPTLARQTAEGAAASMPKRSFVGKGAAEVRRELCGKAEPVGTMSGMALRGMEGKNPVILMDLLGERLSFERAGVRLYEALLSKFDAASVHEEEFTREDLENIHDQELAHYGLLISAFDELGADPTVVTPGADLAGVASAGIRHVLADPRTTFTEGLGAILIAELADNAGWQILSELAERCGLDVLASRFRTALEEEDEHVALIRRWQGTRVGGQLETQWSSTAPSPPP
ncbi:ferritin-like domain-containing protein [Vulgatibacter incomptus]|uniref:Ferritin-like domain-containing protein n=1 Tax=Vulgatibacter incomptus TaxID=1391653 RepID=A0A0K1PHY1_9BACT|nr:ferritin-like domain-containing protein [Vulgatibacter incomptus]AKU93135.1 hypothetical protein AKJ08_3522 [Vulgatibacter incomptus]